MSKSSRSHAKRKTPRHKSVRRSRPLSELLEVRRLLSIAPVPVALNWSPTGIGGTGTSYYANMNPANANEMYLESDIGEVWHTTNAGGTWQTMDKTTQLTSTNIAASVQFTNNSNIAYALDSGGHLKGT